MKGRPRARSTTTRTRTITRFCRWRRNPHRPRSPCRSIPRRCTPRWSCGSCRAKRWRRRSPGRRARSKATCGPEPGLAAARASADGGSRGGQHMVDSALQGLAAPSLARGRARFGGVLRRKSTIAFLMALPLILLIALLVVYPALYSLHLATLNKSMERFVGLGNFTFLFKRETFWMVVRQSCVFAITAVIFKALIGFIVAHFVHHIPSRGQRKWRGMPLVPWVIRTAMA